MGVGVGAVAELGYESQPCLVKAAALGKMLAAKFWWGGG